MRVLAGTASALAVCLSFGTAPAGAGVDPVRPAPAEVRAWYGRTPVIETDEFAFPGWEPISGALVGFDAWRHSASVSAAAYRRGEDMLLITQRELRRSGDKAVWELRDAVVIAGGFRGDRYLMYDCKIGLRGDFVPGLVGAVDPNILGSNPGGVEDLAGPALAAFHIDRESQRLERETLPVYCRVEFSGDH